MYERIVVIPLVHVRAMALFLRGLRPGVSRFRQCLKRTGPFAHLSRNLKDNSTVNTAKYSSDVRSGLSLSDEVIDKFIKRLVEEFERTNEVNAELCIEQGYSEVSRLLKCRSTIEESMKSLEELVEQDAEMKKLSEEEYSMYKEELDKSNEELLDAMLENMGRDNCREIVLEITTGVGGQESMLFATDLFHMYLGYLEYLRFDHEVIQQDSIVGTRGLRHACIAITGDRALEMFRHEGGVHRVQRIPVTERSGRIHTSTVSVAVLPQVSDIEVNLRNKDLRIETKNASGAGGQHVNTTDSAVRITHLPTGISVESQTSRSQIRNRQTAMLTLRMKIYDKQLKEQRATSGEMRRKQLGLGTRNEKVRTYNFNQDRITDHRIADGTTHNLRGFLEGGEDLRELQMKLQRHMQSKMFREAIEKVVK